MADDSPLLASHQDEDTPSLSDTPTSTANEEDGIFSYLLKRHAAQYKDDGEASDTAPLRSKKRPLLFVIGGSLTMLHLGLVGASMAVPWSDTLLTTTLSFMGTETTLIQRMSVKTLFDTFQQAKLNVAWVFLLIAALVAPSLVAVGNLTRLNSLHHSRITSTSLQILIATLVKASMMIVYTMSVLDLAVTHIQLHWTGTELNLNNQIRGGLVAFAMGTTCAMLFASLILFKKTTTQSTTTTTANASSCGTSLLQWQLFAFATILLVPAMTLPLFRISYSGMAAQFMPATSVQIYLKDIPTILWQGGLEAGTPAYMLVFVVGTSMLQTSILPIVALILSQCCCSRRCVRAMFPHVNSITFAATMFCIIPYLGQVWQALMNQTDSHGLCQAVDKLVGEDCLNLQANRDWGVWASLIQAVALELYLNLALMEL